MNVKRYLLLSLFIASASCALDPGSAIDDDLGDNNNHLNPIDPKNPGGSGSPGNPDNPDDPANPDNPDNPGNPDDKPFNPDNPDNGGLPSWDTETHFFIKQSDGSYLFKTSEPAHKVKNGKNFWRLGFYSNSDEISIDLRKSSGMSKYGYGLAFNIEDNKNFMLVLIDINNAYTLGYVKNGVFYYLTKPAWITTSFLKSGQSVFNTITIKRLNNEQFKLILNGKEIDEIFKYYTSARNIREFGLVVVVGEEEKFPTTPVEVSFKF